MKTKILFVSIFVCFVSELKQYISTKVQELTGGKQNPTSRTENMEFDFRVW